MLNFFFCAFSHFDQSDHVCLSVFASALSYCELFIFGRRTWALFALLRSVPVFDGVFLLWRLFASFLY